MRLLKFVPSLAFSLLSALFLLCLSSAAQEKPASPDRSSQPTSGSPLPSKKHLSKPEPDEEQESSASGASTNEADGPEALRRRAEWFYKQRSSASGRIPAGVRLKAFQHMQQMMVREGRLTQRPDGSYAEVTPKSWLSPLGAVTSPWTSVGPTPTTGGFFSPVTGRITTIAVDPSDSTGNTVLIGGAMGGIWRTTDGGTTWTAVGDQNASLAMGSIAFAPSNPSTVYAGTGESESIAFDIYYGAGVLKSTDGGLHWTQTCTVASATCPFIGPYNDITPFGFFTLGGTRITYIAVNPTNPQMVLVGAETQFAEGTTEGVYCTDNGGSTWSNILPDEMSSFVGFASSSVAYAALGNTFGSSSAAPNGNGIYKATGIGSTCTTIHFSRLTALTLPAQPSMGRIDLGIAPSDTTGNTVYASIADSSTASSTNLGVFVTTNGGTSWTQTTAPDVCHFQCWYDNVVKVDPNNSSIAFFGGSSVRDSSGNPSWVVRTTNRGGNWSSVIPNLPGSSAGLPHVDNHAIAFVKLSTGKVRMYLGNDGGIWRTDDAEASTITWTNLNNPGLTLTQFYPFISMNASQPSISFGGTQDNGSQNYQGGTAWVDNQQCGDGGTTAVDAVIPSTVYIGCITGFPVNASYQNGAIGTFSPAVNGINPNDFIGILSPIATDPSNANTVYFGTTKVYQSVDAGNTWTPISNDLVNGSSGDSLNVIAVAPANPGVVYVGANTGNSIGQLTGLVFVSTNVTQGNFSNFFQVSGQGSLPPRALTAIAVDPSDSTGNTAYVTFSGFSFVNASFGINDPTGHIFKTTNGGSTWTDVSCSVSVCTTPAATDLPNIPVNDLVIDPAVPGTLYAATDLGVFVGTCPGSAPPCTWSTLSTGLPRVVVHSLRLHEPSRTLRAGTHGRGAWDISLNNFSFTGPHISSITPPSANVGGAQFTLTVNGSGLTGGTIHFDTTALTTTGTPSDTSMSATVPASLLNSAGTPKITVVNGTQTSNAITFSVLAAVPTLTSISPSSTPVQTTPSTPVQIQLTGTNFSSNVKALFNGAQNGITVAAPTASCQPPTCITATLPAALLGPFGSTNDITVLNTPPGGGQSKAVTFTVVAPPPINDNFANAINITTLSFNDVQDSSGATTETTDPVPSCVTQVSPAQGNTGGHPNGAYNTIWYKFTPIFSASLNVDTSGSSYDSVISIWTGPAGSLVSIACNDDINPGIVLQSQLLGVPLTAGTTYYIMVSSFGPPDPNPLALGGRSQLNFSYNNGLTPAPTISSIFPTSTSSGGPDVSLTVDGTGFLNGATVLFQSPYTFVQTPLATNFVSPTQVTAAIPAPLFVLPGPYLVFAQNQLPTNGESNPVTFTVNLGTLPVPTLNSMNPTTIVAGSFDFTLAAFGNNFASSAVLNFNGAPMPTTTASNAQSVTARVPASAVANAATVQVTVTNPPPGGGTSAALPFSITVPNPLPTITTLNPSTAVKGDPVNLTVTGTGFLPGANICFNLPAGGCNPAFFISSTQLSTTFFAETPTGTGTLQIYVVDPAPGGTSAAATFTVTPPPDFSISSTGTITQTINAGQTATFTNVISVAALNGFASQVNLSCSLPLSATHTTCTVNPNMLASGSGTASVSVTTTANSLLPPSLPFRLYMRPELVARFLLTVILAILILRVARTRRQRFARALPLTMLFLFILLQAIGCGGGSSTPPPPPPPTGTPTGTYTVTVMGTASTNNGTLTHTASLTLTVN